MEFKERDFVPVLFGGDINTYSVARAFYEEYQVKSWVLGKYMSGPSCYSKITNYRNNPGKCSAKDAGKDIQFYADRRFMCIAIWNGCVRALGRYDPGSEDIVRCRYLGCFDLSVSKIQLVEMCVQVVDCK